MIEKGYNNSRSFHLAGIIPLAGAPSNINLLLPNYLLPLSENYTALENAVTQCAYAGCETIWIVCNDDVAPAIKHVLGDYVEDPVWRNRGMDAFPSESRRPIPIYYVPIHPKDRDRRDCLGWSVLHGALTAYHISNQMSKWIIPDRYFVAFSSGVYDPTVLRSYRKQISSQDGFYLSYGNETIRDGHYLSFTFDADDFKRFRREVRKKGTGMWTANNLKDGKYPTEKLPIEKRYSARFFSLDIVFGSAIIEGASVIEVPWYYPLNGWESYRNFLASPEAETIERPKYILPVAKLNPIGMDIEQGEKNAH